MNGTKSFWQTKNKIGDDTVNYIKNMKLFNLISQFKIGKSAEKAKTSNKIKF